MRGATDLLQISELQLFDSSGTPIPTTEAVSVTSENTDSPGAEGPANAFDGLFAAPPGAYSKWLDFTFNDTALIIDFGTTTVGTETVPNSVTINSYNYITGNDAAERDPISWILQGRDDEADPWVTIDVVRNFVPNSARYVPAAASDFVLPVVPPPFIDIFEADFFIVQETIITSDTELFLFALVTEETESLSLSVGGGAPTDVPFGSTGEAFFDTTLPANSDTVLTATATSAGGSDSKDLLVRTVEAETYTGLTNVRFTPIKTRNGQSTTQISDFVFYDGSGSIVIPATATGGATPEALLDSDSITKWVSQGFEPVTFTFSVAEDLSGYAFYAANDTPGMDPLQWKLEGSSDDGTTWFLIDTATGIDYPVPMTRGLNTQDFPLISEDSFTPVVSLALSSPMGLAGEVVTVNYSIEGAASADLQPSPGAIIPASGSGSVDITITEDVDVVLTATSTAGRMVSASMPLLLVPPFDGSFEYPDFDDRAGVMVVGSGVLINDYANIPGDPDADRVRLTGNVNGQSGAAWYYEPIDLTEGFQTTFDMEITSSIFINGADDLVFVVQNTADGNTFVGGQVPDPGTEGASLAVVFDTYQNAGDLGWSSVKVLVNGALVQQVGLAEFGAQLGLTFYDDDGAFDDVWFYTRGYGNPEGYVTDITYVPGSLSVSIGGVTIIDNLDVDLGPTGSSVLDEEGKAFVGFTAHTGGLSENHDIVSWSLTTENVTAPAGELEIVDFSFDFISIPPTITLTWVSEAGMLYDVTSSTTLTNWSNILANDVVGTAGTTTTTVDLPAGTTGFFRVEEDIPLNQ